MFTPLRTSLYIQTLSFDRKQRGDQCYSISPGIKFNVFLFNASTLQFVSGTGQRLTAYRLHIFVRPSGICAGHIVFCSIGTGSKVARTWSFPPSTAQSQDG